MDCSQLPAKVKIAGMGALMRKIIALLLTTGLLVGCSTNSETPTPPEVSSEEAAASAELGQAKQQDTLEAHQETCLALSDAVSNAASVFAQELSPGSSDATKRLRFQTALSRTRTIYEERFDTIIASNESMGIDELVAEVNVVEVLAQSPNFSAEEVGVMLKQPLEAFAATCASNWTSEYIDGLFAMNYGQDYVEVVIPDDLDGHISSAVCDAVQQNIRFPFDDVPEPVIETLPEPYGGGKVAIYACYQFTGAMTTIFEYPTLAIRDQHLTQLGIDIRENSLPNGKLLTNDLFSVFYWGESDVPITAFEKLGFQLFSTEK